MALLFFNSVGHVAVVVDVTAAVAAVALLDVVFVDVRLVVGGDFTIFP